VQSTLACVPPAFDHPRDLSLASGATPPQQQIAAVDAAAELGDGRFASAAAAPDIVQ
jgi:hypothetical protein